MSFQLGPFTVTAYGIIIMVGSILATGMAYFQAKKWREDPEFILDAVIWVFVAGLLGARIWHIFTPPPSSIAIGKTTAFYLSNPLEALAIWEGGLGIPGAIIAGMLALFVLTRRRRKSFARWADIAAPAIALGQGIGRWGNFTNQELYGLPADLPWAISIDLQNRVAGYEQFATFHPLFLYESLWNFANMGLLLWLGHKYAGRLRDGDLLLVYLIVYPLGRFLLEYLRLDAALLGEINANQTMMVFVIILAVFLLWFRHRKAFLSKAEVTALQNQQ